MERVMQIDPKLNNDYEQKKSLYEKLKDEVIFILNQKIREQDVPFEDIYGRLKSIESLQDKINRKECTNPFDEISDICGARVICLFPSDLHLIGNVIETNFSILDKDDKISTKPTESFGYLSIHYIATLHPSYIGPRYDDIKDIRFEIQLRTIAAHAWCTISHHLDYKHPNAVPSNLQKPFQALSALFYLADENFERFYKLSADVKKDAEGKDLKQIAEDEINFDTLNAYLKKRYPNRVVAPAQPMSLLVAELHKANYRTISELDNKLAGTDKTVEKLEREILGNFHNVGMVRNALSIVDTVYNKNRLSPLSHDHIKRREYLRFIENTK